MSKFSKKYTGNPKQKDENGRGKVTSYTASLSISLLKQTGFLLEDGTLLEFEAIAEDESIRLVKKESKYDNT